MSKWNRICNGNTLSGSSLDIQMTVQYVTHTLTHTHIHSPNTWGGVGLSSCRHGAEAPLLMDVVLHPEVMDVGVTAGGGPGWRGGRGHGGHWLVLCPGTLTRSLPSPPKGGVQRQCPQPEWKVSNLWLIRKSKGTPAEDWHYTDTQLYTVLVRTLIDILHSFATNLRFAKMSYLYKNV